METLPNIGKLGPRPHENVNAPTSKMPILALWLHCLSGRQGDLAPMSADVSLWAQWDLRGYRKAKHMQGTLSFIGSQDVEWGEEEGHSKGLRNSLGKHLFGFIIPRRFSIMVTLTH